MRRLPVYLLLDTSGSMRGEPIQALNNALSGMINQLRLDPQAAETLNLSIMSFDREVKQIFPLTDLANVQLPEIICPQSGPTFTGKALEFLSETVPKEIKKGNKTQKGDWKPLLFLFTDGKPSDMQKYREMIPIIKKMDFGVIVGCAAGLKSSEDLLKELTENVVHLETTDSNTLTQFFRWVSDTIEQGNRSVGLTETIILPPPPTDDILVV